jgi:hypothetical protein
MATAGPTLDSCLSLYGHLPDEGGSAAAKYKILDHIEISGKQLITQRPAWPNRKKNSHRRLTSKGQWVDRAVALKLKPVDLTAYILHRYFGILLTPIVGVGLTATPVTLVWDEEPQCKAPRPALEQPPILCDPMDTLTDNSGGQPA